MEELESSFQSEPIEIKTMYGLVNKAIEDLVVSSAGEQTWQRIKALSGLQELQILESSNYDDEITFKLVAAASRILERPVDDILRAFGNHWVMYTGREGWSSLFHASGEDLISFLKNLDDMHSRVNAAMPEGNMPEFTLYEKGDGYHLQYRSSRDGLAPMVDGILNGLTEQFDEPWAIKYSDRREKDGVVTFVLTRLEKRATDDLHDAA